MKILLFDNYDSFTYNLVHAIRNMGNYEIDIYRNNQIRLETIAAYDKIVLSPGPGIPSEAGILLELIKQYAATKSILGVCLGHQAIAESFGGELYNLDHVHHGVASPIKMAHNDYIFDGVSNPFIAGRYHSWAVIPESMPTSLCVTATTDDGAIMALKHNQFDVHGVQFHPESILTPEGVTIIRNFIQHN